MVESYIDSDLKKKENNDLEKGHDQKISTVAASKDDFLELKKNDDDSPPADPDMARENKNVSRFSKKSQDSEIVMIQSSDLNEGKIFRRKETMKDNRTAMERFIDKFWLLNVERTE